MIYGCGKSDEAIVAGKPANKAERSPAELVERRAEAKGNVGQQRTLWTQCQAARVTGAGPHTHHRLRDGASEPEVGAVCGKAARKDLCGGREQSPSLPRPQRSQLKAFQSGTTVNVNSFRYARRILLAISHCGLRDQRGAAVVKVAGDARPTQSRLLKRRRVDGAWRIDAAARAGMRTTRVKGTTGRRVERIGECKAESNVRHAEAGLRRQHRSEQGLGVGVPRHAEQHVAPGELDDTAEIHHGNLGCDMLDHREIVTDEDIGEAKF